MSVTYHDTDEFREARFRQANLSGVTFRDCDLTGLQIIDSIIGDGVISGDFDRLVVNDVDVTDFVQTELDRRQPERVLVRSLSTAQDYRDTWAAIERMWAGTHARLAGLPTSVMAARVDEEWSAVQTLRHLVFATDAWAARAILAQERPYHPAGLPSSGYPGDLGAELGLDSNLTPALAEVLAVRAERMSLVADIVAGLTEDFLARVCEQSPAPGYPEQSRTVARCLRVIMNEEVEHHRYLVRDLALLQASPGPMAAP
jgi:DinB superfamily/Pentapeptide repeats (8 copies)